MRTKFSYLPVLLIGLMMISGAVAYACTNLATLNLSTPTGTVGEQVTVTGSSFRTHAADAPVATFPVELYWNGETGPVLAEIQPDDSGSISATFTIPEAQPGYYVILATQRSPEGIDEYGTPARASFQVLGANGESVVSPAAAEATSASPDAAPAGLIALTAVLAVLGIGLFGAGLATVGRQMQGAPARERVKE